MQQAWQQQLRERAASKLGHAGSQVDAQFATRVLASHNLTNQERGSRLTFRTQGIWTKSRAKDAGYV
eukprot:203693-Pyramimonas_sp.AAC.1